MAMAAPREIPQLDPLVLGRPRAPAADMPRPATRVRHRCVPTQDAGGAPTDPRSLVYSP